jgi:hypothetical protein
VPSKSKNNWVIFAYNGGEENVEMNTLRVKCIKCGREWEKRSNKTWGPQDVSSSLCPTCFVEVASPTIHKKQKKEGNFDCFGKADRYCDQTRCKYLVWCVKNEKAEKKRPE